jgi:hypothetical protein
MSAAPTFGASAAALYIPDHVTKVLRRAIHSVTSTRNKRIVSTLSHLDRGLEVSRALHYEVL